MSRFNTLMYGDLPAVLDELEHVELTTEELQAAVSNLARRMQYMSEYIAKLEAPRASSHNGD